MDTAPHHTTPHHTTPRTPRKSRKAARPGRRILFVPREISDEFDVSVETARNYLDELVTEGLVDRKKPGERTVIYWVTDEGVRHSAEMTASESS
ncbi:MAG: hypothetical protein ABEJ79_04815 [Halolamina sp.]